MKNKLYVKATHYNSSHKGTQILMDFVNEYNELTPGVYEIAFPLTDRDVETIANELDYKLSPENLHEDGEISNAEADRKARKLMTVVHNLRKYCNKNKLKPPNITEAWD